ncbi:MAG: cadherin-like beta sandwich domain-containing protein [Clostridiales bacterium]|nr:cadherin-like beta sandwich domain-containing protein [Clostridiales bacterium]MDY6117540.1 cadherin-like beta sandwich domain-containing protein [Anaerovoracaceae bacterium]
MRKSAKKMLRASAAFLLAFTMIVQMMPTNVLAVETEKPDNGSVQSEAKEVTQAKGQEPSDSAEPKADNKPLNSNFNLSEALFKQAPMKNENKGAEREGSFYFMALAGNKIIVKPEEIKYGIGDTVASALGKTENNFKGLDTGDVTSINGVEGAYKAISNKSLDLGDLNVNPEPIKENLLLLSSSDKELQVSSHLLDLSCQLIRYEKSEKAKAYIVAKNLYDGILKELAGIVNDDARCKELYDNLKKAIDDAEKQDENTKYPVKLSLKTDDDASDEISITFTNIYGGKVTAKDGETIQLLAGEHKYVATLPRLHKKATGKFTVEESEKEQIFKINIPGDDYWLSRISMGTSWNDILAKYDPIEGLDFDFNLLDSSKDNQMVLEFAPSETAEKFGENGSVIIKYDSIKDGKPLEERCNLADRYGKKKWINNFIPKDGTGRSNPYVVELVDLEKKITYTQEFTINLKRPPSLVSLDVLERQGAALLSPDFASDKYNYTAKVLEGNENLEIQPKAFGRYENGYKIYVNDNLIEEDNSFVVPLKSGNQAQDPIKIKVINNYDDKGKVYTVKPELVPKTPVKITVPSKATLEVINSAGSKVQPVITDVQDPKLTVYTFHLAKDLEYKYVLTEKKHFKTKSTFVAKENLSLEADVDTTARIKSIDLIGAQSDDPIISASDSSLSHELSTVVADYMADTNRAKSKIKVVLKDDKENVEIKANYKSQVSYAHQNNQPKSVILKSGTAKVLADFLAKSGRNQNVDLVVSRKDGNLTREEIYKITIERDIHLSDEPAPTFMYDGMLAGCEPKFDVDKTDGYEVIVPQNLTSLLVTARQNPSTNDPDVEEPYTITINGEKAEPFEKDPSQRAVSVALNGTQASEEIVIKATSPAGAEKEYRFKVKKVESFDMTFNLQPEDGILVIHDQMGTRIWPKEDGTYSLLDGAKYKYDLSKTGYISLHEEFTADKNINKMDLSLKEAKKNENIDPTLDVEWNKFRGDDNAGVTKQKTPTSAETTQLKWAYKSSNMSHIGQPIVLDNYVAVINGNKLQYLDPINGKLVAEGIIVGSGGLTPVYGEGMIFVPSTNCIQAFNATPRPQTEKDEGYTNKDVMVLDSLWVYKDSIGGAAYMPWYISNGYLYGGWEQMRKAASVVCLSITDEDPTQTHEEKQVVWRHTRNVGSRWAGVYANDRFVVFTGQGDDDLTCVDARTGRVLDTMGNILTAQSCSSVAYDKKTDRYCFTTKDSFYSVKIDDKGHFYDLKQCKIGGMSTSTPAVYNGRAYIGVAGKSQFQSFGGHGILVLDIEKSETVYKMLTQGYPQASALISTAYENKPILNPQTGKEETGFVYVYITENINPGRAYYFVDKPGITEPVIYSEIGGLKTAPVLFTPKGDHSQYNLSSLQVDKDGTLYMKTDKAYILAMGPTIEKLEIKKEPEKTVYYPGDTFDPKGMKIIAKYANGVEKDVTKYIKFSEDAMTQDQSSVDATFPYALYNEGTPNDYIDSKPQSTFDKLPRPEVKIPVTVLKAEDITTVEEIEKLIKAIGEVDYNEESKNKIDKARKAYNKADPSIRPAVKNYSDLEAAEARYELFDQADKGKLAASEVVSDPEMIDIETVGEVKVKTEKKDILKTVTLNVEELKAVEKGKKIKIRIIVKKISKVPETEKLFLEAGLQEHKLKEADYVLDILCEKEVEGFEPVIIKALFANKTIRLELKLPENEQIATRTYYMLNIHGMGSYLLKDMDENSDTISIDTGRFSTYVLTYAWLDSNPGKDTPEPSNPEPSNPGKPNTGGNVNPVLPSGTDTGGLRARPTRPNLSASAMNGENISNGKDDAKLTGKSNKAVGKAIKSSEKSAQGQKVIESASKNKGASSKLDKAGQNLKPILIISGIGIAILLLLYFLLKRRKQEEE